MTDNPNDVYLASLDGTDGFKITDSIATNPYGYGFGEGVAVGDINGDGFKDVIVGDIFNSQGARAAHGYGYFSGAVYVLFGHAGGFSSSIDIQSVTNGHGGFQILAGDSYAKASSEIATGDVNGDGFTDLLIAAPFDGSNYSSNYSSHGSVYVILGGPELTHNLLLQDDGSTPYLFGPDGSVTGNLVFALGDINGDGAADFSVSSQNGQAYVVYGNPHGFSTPIDVSQMDASTGFLVTDAGAPPAGIQPVGDINGDGLADFVVNLNGGTHDTAEIVFGSTNGFGSALDAATLGSTAGVEIVGVNEPAPGQAPATPIGGFTVTSAGDINGDGIADFAVIESDAENGAGAVYIVFGHQGGFGGTLDLSSLDGTNGFEIKNLSGNVGTADFNGDGYTDLVLTDAHADNNAGAAYVIFGHSGSFSNISADNISASVGLTIHGDPNNPNFDLNALPIAGDINGDGFDDLLFGSYVGTHNESAWVVFGHANTIPGTSGDDILTGTPGKDLLTGGAGNDTIDGGAGDDTAAFSGDRADYQVVYDPASNSFTVTDERPNTPDGTDTLTNIEHLQFADGTVPIGTPPASISLGALDGTNGFVLDGANSFDFFGAAVAHGDVNGDGIPDLVVGAPGADGGAGATYVFYGTSDGSTPTPGLVIHGAAAGDASGTAVAVGDINGDGYADVVIGAPEAASGAGSAYVVFGSASGGDVSLGSLDGTNGFAIAVNGASSQLGHAVATADLNGDGVADLIVSQPGYGGNAGATYVVYGHTGAFDPSIGPATLDGSNGFTILGDGSELSGSSIANAGDINGDGIDDLIIGARQASPDGQYSGAAYVVFGNANGFGATLDLSALDGTNGFKIDGTGLFEQLGWTVSAAGDLNGDGVADLVVSAPPTNNYAGAAYVVFGDKSGLGAEVDVNDLNGHNGFTITDDSQGDYAGFSVSAAGDVNGDGFADLIIGAKHADGSAGAAYVVYGRDGGFPANIDVSQIDGINGFKIAGDSASDQAGFAVSAAGDLNGDGFADILVSAYTASPNGATNAGEAYVVYGSAPDAPLTRVGNDSDNTIHGGAFDDTLSGLGGNDTLIGGGGNDTLDGGTGDDTAVFSGNRADYHVVYDAGTATFTVTDERPNAPDGTDTVTNVEHFQFADGTIDTATLTNSPPVTVDDTVNAFAGTAVGVDANISVLNNDSDPDGDTLTVTAVNGDPNGIGSVTGVSGTYGTLYLNADGTYGYAADNAAAIASASGSGRPTDRFTVTVDDGHGGTATETLSFVIDRQPVAVDDTALVVVGQTASADATHGVLVNDSDPDGDALSVFAFIAGTDVQHAVPTLPGGSIAGLYGTLTLGADGSYSYAADNAAGAPANATDVFSYGVQDTSGALVIGTLTFTLEPLPQVSADAANAVAAGPAATGNVLANDTDGATLSVLAVNGQSNAVGSAFAGTYGSLTLNSDGSYSYTADNASALAADPSSNYPVDSFAVTVTNSQGAATDETLTFTIDRAPGTSPVTADAQVLASGTISAASNQGILSADSDPDGDSLSVVAVGGAAQGVGASVAGTYGHLTLQADGSYSYTADDAGAIAAAATGSHLVDTFTLSVGDGQGGATDQTLSFTIDRAPGAVAGSGAVFRALTTTGNVLTNDSDPDGDALTVSAVNGVAGNVAVSVAGTYGHLTLNANGSYSYAADNTSAIGAAATGSHPIDTFAYTASDGLGGTTSSTLSFTIDRVAATATQSVGVLKGASVSGSGATGLLAGVTDPDGDTLTVTAVNGSANSVGHLIGASYGNVTVNADGSFTYTANSTITAPTGSHPTDQIAVTVSDGHGGTSTINLDMVIDRPPGSGAGNGSIAAGTTVQGNVEAVSDPDGDTITVTSVAGSAANVGQTIAGAYGHMTVNANGTYTYVADNAAAISAASSRPTESFSVVVSDGHGGTGSVSLGFTIDRLPVVSTHTATAETSQSTGSSVLSGDTDPDNDSLSVIALNGSGNNLNKSIAGTYGHIVVNGNGNYTYTADNTAAIAAVPKGQPIVDSFTVLVYDGYGGSATETLNITVVNPPVAVADTAVAVAGATMTATAATGVLANDSDPGGETLSVFAFVAGTNAQNATPTYPGGTAAGTYGHLTMNADGSYSYAADNTAGAPAHATDVFTYAVENTDGGLAPSTLTFTLDNAPVAAGDMANVLQGGTATGAAGAILANDTDSDGDTLTVSAVAGSAANVGTSTAGTYGHLTLNANGSYSYVADNTAALSAAATGSKPVDSFAVTVSDGHGGTASETLNFTIDRAPVAVADSASLVQGATASATAGTGILANDSDADGDTLTVSAVAGAAGNVGASVAGTYGHLTLNADGSYSYVADNTAALSGAATGSKPVDSFAVTVSDGHGGTATETLGFTIDRAPIAAADTQLVYEGGGRSMAGSPSVPTGPLQNDGDPDGDSISIVAVNGLAANVGTAIATTYGHITLSANGSYSYSVDNTAAIDATDASSTRPVDVITYTISDGHGGTATTTDSFTIARAPIAVADTAAVLRAQTVSATAATGVLANDRDPDGNPFAVVAVNGLAANANHAVAGTYGHLTLNNDGSYAYTADNTAAINAVAGAHAVDTFTYTVTDVGRAIGVSTVSFTIDRAPTVTTDTAELQAAATATADVHSGALANDSDADGDTLTVSAVAGAAGNVGTSVAGTYGHLTLNADGSYSYVADNAAAINAATAGTPTVDTFAYTASDGHGGTTASTLSFTIDHLATAANDAFTATETTAIGAGLSLFANNGSGADGGSGLSVIDVNGAGASVGTPITLASGALLTVNADGTFSYDPNHAFDYLAAPGSGASDTSATDSFTYSLNGGSTATATVTVTGVDSNDTVLGTSGADTLSAGIGNDIVTGGGGNDVIDGGAGIDTAVYSGAHTDYLVGYNATTQAFTVADQRAGSPDGTDTVTNVEQFQFSDGLFTYDTSGNVTSQIVTNGDGSTITTLFDPSNTAPWTSNVTTTDTAGSVVTQTVLNDNGGKWVNTYDTTNASAELWDTKHYDASGNLLQQTVTNGDATHSLTLYDVANQYAWANATVTFDANWNVTGVTGTNDDGSTTVTMGKIAAALDTLQWFATPYDANQGAPVALTLSGGAHNDVLYGHAGNDTISGGAGNDLIVGGTGNDVLSGGTGNDTFVFTNGDGLDTITDFTHGGDVIDLHAYGISSFTSLQPLMSQVGGDTVIAFDPDNQITLHNVTMSQLNAGDFLFH